MKFLFVVEPISYEWLGIEYVSSTLKKYHVDTKLFVIGEDINDILDWKPDFIGYSLLTGSHRNLLEFNQKLKKRLKFTSVFGGPHPTYFPEMANELGVDYIVRGESEEVLKHLLSKPKEKVIFGKLPENLDALPFPDHSLVYDHVPKERNNPIRHFLAARGCPFSCPYCYNNAGRKLYPGQKWVRYRSPQNVIQEIKEVLKQYGGKYVYFQDDCFDADKKWLNNFLDIYQKEIGLPFHCILRLDLLTEPIVKKLKESNCTAVRCAVESGNDKIRYELLKRQMSREQILKSTKLLRKYDIKFVLQNILGLPGSTLKIDFETLRLNIKCRPTLGWVSIFQPYPGTELGDRFPNLTIEKIKSNFYEESPLNIPYKKELSRFQKLFGITAQFPFLYPFLPLLIKLPLDGLYRKLWVANNKRADDLLYQGII
jgi:radical SAM superfamily enzyme YgiQ (UPF0313 family)